jgi:Bor protein
MTSTPMRRVLRALVALSFLAPAACYHQIVETGRPASPDVIDKPWQMSFIYGLVPPPVEETASRCPNGVAKVETQHSFLNGLVASITFGIVTPIQVTVTCAASAGRATGSAAAPAATRAPRPSDEAPLFHAGSSAAEREAAFEAAIAAASASGRATLVAF